MQSILQISEAKEKYRGKLEVSTGFGLSAYICTELSKYHDHGSFQDCRIRISVITIF